MPISLGGRWTVYVKPVKYMLDALFYSRWAKATLAAKQEKKYE